MLDAEKGKVTIIQDELVDLNMPAMTMVFEIGDLAMFDELSEGQAIQFVPENV